MPYLPTDPERVLREAIKRHADGHSISDKEHENLQMTQIAMMLILVERVASIDARTPSPEQWVQIQQDLNDRKWWAGFRRRVSKLGGQALVLIGTFVALGQLGDLFIKIREWIK